MQQQSPRIATAAKPTQQLLLSVTGLTPALRLQAQQPPCLSLPSLWCHFQLRDSCGPAHLPPHLVLMSQQLRAAYQQDLWLMIA